MLQSVSSLQTHQADGPLIENVTSTPGVNTKLFHGWFPAGDDVRLSCAVCNDAKLNVLFKETTRHLIRDSNPPFPFNLLHTTTQRHKHIHLVIQSLGHGYAHAQIRTYTLSCTHTHTHIATQSLCHFAISICNQSCVKNVSQRFVVTSTQTHNDTHVDLSILTYTHTLTYENT